MKFFSDLKSSVYDPKFYANIPFVKGGRAFGYFALLTLCLAIVHTALLAPKVLDAQKQFPSWVAQVIEQYPDGLEVKIRKGKVSTNVKEPYFIKVPNGSDNILVIDTKTPYSAEQFEEYDSPVWLTKDSLVSRSDSKTEIQSLEDVEEFTINNQLVDQTGGKLKPFVATLAKLFLPLTAVGLWLYYFTFKLFYLLIFSLVALFIAKAFKQQWRYSDAYKAGLFAITPALVVQLLVDVFSLPSFMFMVSSITALVLVVNLAGASKTKTS